MGFAKYSLRTDWEPKFGPKIATFYTELEAEQSIYEADVRGMASQVPISHARLTGRCNTIQSVDSTMLPWEKRSVWLYSVKT